MTPRGRATGALAAAAVAVGLVSCTPAADADPADGLSGTLTVFAAASLTETFDALAEEFEARHPGVEVVLNYGGSSALAQQILTGAPADVLAAASEATMQAVVEGGLAADPVVFATNALQLAVPVGNPAGVTGLDDLARPELAIALCDVAMPCGAAADALLAEAGIVPAPDTLEEDVKAVLTKVRLGEADAGLVYATDVRAAGDDVQGIDIAGATQVANRYPVAVIDGSPHHDLARDWIALLTGPDGQAVLAEAGFGAP